MSDLTRPGVPSPLGGVPRGAAGVRPSLNGRAHALDRADSNGRWRAQELELATLIARIAAADQQAMAVFYDRTQRLVFTLVQRIVGANDVAEEVVLDVFMQVWRTAATFERERGRVSTWLLTLARSRALDRRRSQAARQEREGAWSELLGAELAENGGAADPVRRNSQAERAEIVHSAIRALPDDQRRAIELAYFPGLSHVEIAERTGEPLGTVKTRIRLGMIKLKSALEALEHDALDFDTTEDVR